MADSATIATATEATIEAPPNSERLEAARIREAFPTAVTEVNTFRGDTRITVRREQIQEILTLLRDDADLQYNFFSECLGVDYMDPNSDELILDARRTVVFARDSVTGCDHRTDVELTKRAASVGLAALAGDVHPSAAGHRALAELWRRYVLEACRGLEGTLEGGQSLFSCAEAPRAHTRRAS